MWPAKSRLSENSKVWSSGLNKIYSFVVIISSTNKYSEHKSSMLISVLPVDKMILTQTFTMAKWQIVVKKSEATNQTKDQNNNKNKQTNKQTKHCGAVKEKTARCRFYASPPLPHPPSPSLTPAPYLPPPPPPPHTHLHPL